MFTEIELLIPFIIVAYTMWVTPGPNNMMLAYSGARFGFKETLPHIIGVIVGSTILNVGAIFGLKPLLTVWPELLHVLKIVGSVWLVLIGWKMTNAQNKNNSTDKEHPMRFLSAAMFQFANPKAISATLASVTLVLVALQSNPRLLWAVVLLIPLLSFMACIPWVFAGQSIRRFLSTPRRWKMFAWTAGGLTASCALFLWI